MNTQDASADTTPVVIEQPPIAVDTQPAALASQPQGEFNPDIFIPVDSNPDIFFPADPVESRADVLARLVNSNLQSTPPLTDYLTADQLREVFLPIIDFMRAVEGTTHVPVVYAQPGLPSSAQGLDGDLWVSEASADLYIKQEGRWRASTRLRGLDGATPIKGVDYVDTASLGAYASYLKDSAVQEAKAQVSQTVQTVLANVKTTDGRGLVYSDTVINPPLTDTLEPAAPEGTVPAPGVQPMPDRVETQIVTVQLRTDEAQTQEYGPDFVFTHIVRPQQGVGLTCEVVNPNSDAPSVTYTIPFSGMLALVNIQVPRGGRTVFRLYTLPGAVFDNPLTFNAQGYYPPTYSAQL